MRISDWSSDVCSSDLVDQGLCDDLGVAGRARRRLGLRPGDDVELADAVIFVVRRLGRGIALALFCNDMDPARPFRRLPDILQPGGQVGQVMAVTRADIRQAQPPDKTGNTDGWA